MMKHRGFKVSMANGRSGCEKALIVKIDGYVFDVRTLDRDRARAFASAVTYIEDSIGRPDAFEWTRHLTSAQLARKVSA